MKHRLRTHKWEQGKLHYKDTWFFDLPSALAEAEEAICDFFKIFDELGELLYSGGNGSPDYA